MVTNNPWHRMMFYECDPRTCASGDQCGNRRFQKKAFVKELEPFQVRLLYT